MSIRLEARNRGNIRLDMDNASLAAKYAREAGAAEKAAELSAANAAGAAERADAAAEAALRAEAGAQSAAVHLPQPGENGTWLVWDQAGDSYVDSGENCTGVQGERGLKGDTGDKGDKGDTGSKGDDGVSPTVTVTDITGGHRVTITDANHPQGQPFDVMDGEVAQEDFDELSGDVDDLKSAMQSNVDFLYVTSNIVTQHGLTIEKINDTTFQIYGKATATRYFTLFNNVELTQVTSNTPVKTVPAGEYTIEINSNNPALKIRYTLADVWSGALPLENGVVDFTANAAISFLANSNTDFGTSENPSIIQVRIMKTVTSAVPWIMEPSNGDDTPAVWLNLYRYGKCELIEGIYHFAKLRMPENSILSGCGNKSSIIVTDTVGIYPTNSCVVRDIAMDGGGEDDVIPTEDGSKNGIVIAVENVRRVRIENCYIHGFASSAIVARDIGAGIRTDIVISHCNLWYNFRGIYIRRDAEFMMISDCNICCNYFGVLNRGGNNKFSNCDIDSNIINVQIDQDEGSNGGHGSMVGCSFNHSNNRGNDGYSLIIKGTGRELISGCNFYYGKTRLENTNGNVFSGCGFGNATGIEIEGGKCSIFNGCCFKSAQDSPISRVNNDTVEFIDCYTRQGDAVESTEDQKAPVIIDTASGAIANFEDGAADMPIKSLTVNIEPVQSGSGDPSPTNVRPISGWTGCTVTRTGKNLWGFGDQSFTQEKIFNFQTPIPAGTYMFSAVVTSTAPDTCNIVFLDGDGGTYSKYISHSSSRTSITSAFVTTKPITMIVLRSARNYSESSGIDATYADIQLELGSTATAYEPYQGNTYNITFPSEAGTVYGGTLDVTSGVLTVDRFLYVYDGTESFAKSGTALNGFYNDLVANTRPHNWPKMANYNRISQITNERSSMFMPTRNVNTYKQNYGYVYFDSGHNFDAPPETFGTTVESFKAKLAELYAEGTPVSVFCKIATPQTYQLTPTEVTTLLGINNIWADCGSVSVDYPADTKLYIQKVNKPTDDDMTADAQIASGKYFLIGNTLYLSTTVIPAGDTIIPGTNCTKTDLAAALNALNT